MNIRYNQDFDIYEDDDGNRWYESEDEYLVEGYLALQGTLWVTDEALWYQENGEWWKVSTGANEDGEIHEGLVFTKESPENNEELTLYDLDNPGAVSIDEMMALTSKFAPYFDNTYRRI